MVLVSVRSVERFMELQETNLIQVVRGIELIRIVSVTIDELVVNHWFPSVHGIMVREDLLVG